MNTEDITPAKELYKLGSKQVIQIKHDDTPVFVIPNDMKVETLEKLVEATRQFPRRLTETIRTLSAESFLEYFNRFATESSTILADNTKNEFMAIIDFHESHDKANWKSHKLLYACPTTKEWNCWFEKNNEKMTQEDFAFFLEENIREIVEPNGAVMLEIAATLKASNNVDFRSAIRLNNGEIQFNYIEKIEGAAGVNGQLSIPEKFKLLLTPFIKGPSYEIEARFRYRVHSGGVHIWYTLIRPHVFLDDALTEVFEKIKTGMSKGHMYLAKTSS